MNTLNKKEYKALTFAYSQGVIDAHNLENHFGKVIANWFGINVMDEEEDDDE